MKPTVSWVDKKNLTEAYAKYGKLVEGIKHSSDNPRSNELDQNKAVMLLENAVNSFCQKNRIQGGYEKLLETMTTNADAATFVTTEMPMILKVFPNMISKDLISIQPMSQPTTKIFYYDILRDDATSLSAAIHTNRTYANNVEYNESSAQAIKEIELSITDATVSATEKKLKARWTVESEQDIYSYHGISVESDLSNALSGEIVREWDRTILQALLDGATGGTATFDQTEPAGLTYEDRKFWMETLFEKVLDIDNQIYKKTYRRTNWIVVPADVAVFIEKMDGFKGNLVNFDQMVVATGGRYFSGTLNNRWKVYVDPFFPSNKVMIGISGGSDWLSTSAVFSPYILSFFSDTYLDPQTFVKTRSILSRAALKVVRPDMIGVLSISGS